MSGDSTGGKLWPLISGVFGARGEISAPPWMQPSSSQTVHLKNSLFSSSSPTRFRCHRLLHHHLQCEERIGHVHHFTKFFFVGILPNANGPVPRRSVVDLLQF